MKVRVLLGALAKSILLGNALIIYCDGGFLYGRSRWVPLGRSHPSDFPADHVHTDGMPHPTHLLRTIGTTFVAILALTACGDSANNGPISAAADSAKASPVPQSEALTPSTMSLGPIVAASINGKDWQPPTEADIPSDSLGASIRRGLALLRRTSDSLPEFAPGHISCTNCHVQDGRALNGSPLVVAHVVYPKYIARSAAVVSLADRINFCITRSLGGNRLSSDSREMTDMQAYLAFLARDLPVGRTIPGVGGLPRMTAPAMTPDSARGAGLYEGKCQMCHQANGGGGPLIPALWGPTSFSIGASMARVERAASFIKHNMPLGQAGSLTDQEAFDLAAYVNSHPRLDLPNKQNDWPNGGAPVDLPYSTRSGQQAVNPPRLLARPTPKRALVPAPARAGGKF